jgi:hypothetical protein
MQPLAEIYLNSPLVLKAVMVFGTFLTPVACIAAWRLLPMRSTRKE